MPHPNLYSVLHFPDFHELILSSVKSSINEAVQTMETRAAYDIVPVHFVEEHRTETAIIFA